MHTVKLFLALWEVVFQSNYAIKYSHKHWITTLISKQLPEITISNVVELSHIAPRSSGCAGALSPTLALGSIVLEGWLAYFGQGWGRVPNAVGGSLFWSCWAIFCFRSSPRAAIDAFLILTGAWKTGWCQSLLDDREQGAPVRATVSLLTGRWCVLFQWSPSEKKPGQAMSPLGLTSLRGSRSIQVSARKQETPGWLSIDPDYLVDNLHGRYGV